jgi:lipid II:glycine glycyltransferase (peptidoglycan interpeptide bridge formation enzyme)
LPFKGTESGKWDSGTPDFTGPLMFSADNDLAAAFPALCSMFFQSEGIVTEFAHLHPWSSAQGLLEQSGRIYNRDIVWIDLCLSSEELWRQQLQHSCRKNITVATQEGVKVFSASTDDHIREFCRIYEDTMQRNNALEGYYFPASFFRAFRDELPENARFVFAEYKDQIVAATLYLHDDTDVFSFLGGADAAFQYVRPTNAVIWETIHWAQQAGKKRLILGGGYKPDDGIFRFKSTFSRLRQAFYIYKRVHLEQDYALLERSSREHYGIADDEVLSYFPSYRQVHARGQVSKA